MGDAVQINPDDTAAAGRALADTSEEAAGAGAAFLTAAGAVRGLTVAGSSIAPTAAAVGDAYAAACTQIVESAQGVGGLIQQAAMALAEAEQSALGRFGALRAI